MAKTIRYAIRCNGKWLKDIEPNQYYCSSATAPTMGARHDSSEYRTIWGDEPVYFEKLTAVNRVKVFMEEQRWEDVPIENFEIIPE